MNGRSGRSQNCGNRFVVPAVAGPSRLVPLVALVRPGITARALRAAAVRGALQAAKGPDGRWRSSQKWVMEYVTKRQKGRIGSEPEEKAC